MMSEASFPVVEASQWEGQADQQGQEWQESREGRMKILFDAL
jgi:hypothetical protein